MHVDRTARWEVAAAPLAALLLWAAFGPAPLGAGLATVFVLAVVLWVVVALRPPAVRS